MPKIFISYRRQDTGQIVASIYNFIAEAFGPESVFVDTRDIPDGAYFKLVIEHNLRDAKVMLVVIGNNWLGIQNGERRRIDAQDDLVRAEVRLGLELARQGQVTLIPVLVDDTAMPQPQQLPPELAELPWRNAAHMHSSLTYFTDDINRLLDDIDKAGVPRRVHGRIEHAPNRFALLAGAQIVDSGSSQSPQTTSHPSPSSSPAAVTSPAPPRAPSSLGKSPVPTSATAGTGLLQLILALLLELPGIVKGFIVLVVIVGVVAAVHNLATPGLTEHSTCQQFEQADYTSQTQVLQQMMAAHGTSSDQLSTTRLSVGLYCNVMGPNVPIDGIYNG